MKLYRTGMTQKPRNISQLYLDESQVIATCSAACQDVAEFVRMVNSQYRILTGDVVVHYHDGQLKIYFLIRKTKSISACSLLSLHHLRHTK